MSVYYEAQLEQADSIAQNVVSYTQEYEHKIGKRHQYLTHTHPYRHIVIHMRSTRLVIKMTRVHTVHTYTTHSNSGLHSRRKLMWTFSSTVYVLTQ